MKQKYKLTEWNRQTAAFGLQELAKAFSCGSNRDDEFVRNIKGSMRYLQEFLGEINPTPELSEKDADMSSSLHTYLRKANDEPYSTIIYRMVHESRGIGIWLAFCKSLANNPKEMNYHEAINQAYKTSDSFDSTDDIIMLSALKMWENDWKYTKEWFK